MGSSSSSTSPLSLKILLISTVILTAATALNFFFPLLLNFSVYDVPIIWSIILSWLKPPYLYIVVNGIIITIVASSRLQRQFNHYQHNLPQTNSLLIDDQPSNFDGVEHVEDKEGEGLLMTYEIETPVVSDESMVLYEIEQQPVVDVETVFVKDLDVVTDELADDKFVISKPTSNVWSDVDLTVREMPLVSSRFAHQRRLTKVNPDGVKSLRVSKPRKHETLESTWKMITDGRHIPLNRHLRRPDAFENRHHHAPPLNPYDGEQGEAITSVVPDYTVTDKSEPFTDHRNHRVLSSRNQLPPSGGKLRKEGSLSHDELNRRVEAFIKKFNDEMRLQRQESLKRYMEMINRGAE